MSLGCTRCYAERQALRIVRMDRGLGKPEGQGAYDGLVREVGGEARWTGQVRLVPGLLGQPMRWKRPRRIFVNSMSDLFHEGLNDAQIAAVFGAMALAPQHTFQVLTKRPERMLRWLRFATEIGEDLRASVGAEPASGRPEATACVMHYLHERHVAVDDDRAAIRSAGAAAWPLPNVWLGVSAEDQATLDARVPDLLRCPAAVRWVSLEPQIGPIRLFPCDCPRDYPPPDGPHNKWCQAARDAIVPRLDWVVQGGESGPRARPFNVAWARSVRDQCKAAGVAFFLKQLGARPAINPMEPWGDLRDRSGSDPDEWPEDLRVREFPEVRR